MRLGRFCFSALIGAAILLAPVHAGAASYFPLAYWLDGDDFPGEPYSVRHYAAQDIRTNDLRAEYFGWKGVKGAIYWAKSRYLPPEANFALGCLSMKTASNDWLQAGIRHNRGGSLRRIGVKSCGRLTSTRSQLLFRLPYSRWAWVGPRYAFKQTAPPRVA